MKSHLAVALTLFSVTVLLAPTALKAQFAGSASDGTMLALSGKVQVEGGADVPSDTDVVLECGTRERARAHVDSKGRFSFVVTSLADPQVRNWDQTAESTLTNCTLRAQAGGQDSTVINLAGEPSTGVVQVATIMLRPVGGAATRVEDFTVSAASLAAPDKAKKDFQRGQEQAKKGKWSAAADYFKRAVQAYPRYALAWLELGRAQVQQNNLLDAQQSFQQAATQDSKLLPAYMELASVQAEQKNWKALAETADKLVQLAPDRSPVFWFLDSAANYNLKNLERAESSAARGLRLDANHKVPQLEYLYGLTLAAHEKYGEAVQHIKTYLQLAPKAVDATSAQQKLAEFDGLASQTAAVAQH